MKNILDVVDRLVNLNDSHKLTKIMFQNSLNITLYAS